VSALGVASIGNILKVMPRARILLQNWGEGEEVTVRVGGGEVAVRTTRLHASTSFRMTAGTRHLSVLAAIHRCLPGWLGRRFCAVNGHFAALAGADSVLALSGGDSLSDIYGPQAVEQLSAMMMLLARMGKQIILMPQTIGPFRERQSRDVARSVLSRCDLVATRDVGGAEELRNTLGGWLPDRVVECPDVAFTLDAVAPDAASESFACDDSDDRPLIGLNVSGLLYLSTKKFGLKESYVRLVEAIVEWAVGLRDRRLLLVPHVISRKPPDQDPSLRRLGSDVSDTAACRVVYESWIARLGDRIGCLGWPHTESETKYLIGRCEFMIGARMHSCIAGVSQGVPTVTLAYSKKAEGVMGHLGEWAPVVDLRSCSIGECVRVIKECYERRMELRSGLLQAMPGVRARVERFFSRDLYPVIRRSGTARLSAGS